MQEHIGLLKGSVMLHEYNEYWRLAFQEEKSLLEERFPNFFLEISHGGSTSVPGMTAKPIIDIFAAMERLEDYVRIKEALEAMEYEYHGEDGVSGRQFFMKRRGEYGTHHLQLMTRDSVHWVNHIALREYYMAHPEVREEYILLKRKLAERYPEDRESYSKGKKEFVNATLIKAREFYKFSV